MIHTLYRRATRTFHTPSWVTSYLLLVFLSSSSLQFVFSEQLRFEHQLRSQLLWFKRVSRSIKTSTNRRTTSFKQVRIKINQSTMLQPSKQSNKDSRSLRQQGFRELHWASSSPLLLSSLGTLKPHKGFKWSPDRSSKRRFLKTKTCHIPRAKSFTQHQTASEKETSQPLLDTIPGLLFDFHTACLKLPNPFSSLQLQPIDSTSDVTRSKVHSNQRKLEPLLATNPFLLLAMIP